ncbi:YkvA family protein [Chromohalobacter sp. 11-W]|uniref:YkvA family protein n=1 Tax=Chromohalobacter sp. 11-W TaxID=2994061 RepID=UPI00246924DF|nr:YkvA family protein [Chromohalobacter sp. 11-W]
MTPRHDPIEETPLSDTGDLVPGGTVDYADTFQEQRFWHKITRYGRRAGREVTRRALQLYFVLQRPDVPVWAKTTIFGALGYFISPLDAIPDLIPAGGYVDDASVLGAALIAVSVYIDDDVKARADNAMPKWL